jgi:hypothetical protein
MSPVGDFLNFYLENLANLEGISLSFGHGGKGKGVSYPHARCDYGLWPRRLAPSP